MKMKNIIIAVIVLNIVFLLTGCKEEMVNNDGNVNSNLQDVVENQESMENNSNEKSNLLEEILKKVKTDDYFSESSFFEISEVWNDVLPVNENVIEDSKMIYGVDGTVCIFKFKEGADLATITNQAISLEGNSLIDHYMFNDEKYIVIRSDNCLVMILAKSEESIEDADKIKEIIINYFGESNIETIHEKKLEGTHVPMEEDI